MMLVLIALFMGTIIASAYLASRDNSKVIGQNITAAAEARWAATSGIELAVAVMQTEEDWRTLHSEGKLLDDYPIGDGTLDIDLIDIETDAAPTAETSHFRVLATATVDGVEQYASATAYVEPVPPESADVDLSEFVVFASDHIALYDNATVSRWAEAPLSELGERLAFGTQSKDLGAISLNGDSVAIDTTVYHGPGASPALVKVQGPSSIDETSLADDIPLPDPPVPDVEFPKDSDSYPYIDVSAFTFTLDSDYRAGSAIHKFGSDITYEGDITVTVNHDFQVESGSTLTIDGNVTLIVFDDFRVKQSAIQLTEDSTLTIFVRDDFELDDAYIGEAPYDSETSHDSTGHASYMDPQSVVIYSIEPDTASTNWNLKGTTVVKGSIYAPHTENLEILNDSALYGRIAVQGIEIKNDAGLFYDHSLDTGTGYTSDKSAIFDEDGNIKDVFKALASLDDASLEALAAGGFVIFSGEKTYGESDEEEGEGGGSGPTPRTVEVEYELVAFGSDPQVWEAAGITAVNVGDERAAAIVAAAHTDPQSVAAVAVESTPAAEAAAAAVNK